MRTEEMPEKGFIDSPYDDSVAPMESSTTMLAQTSPEPVLIKLEFGLRGYVFNHKTGDWEKRYNALVNEEGINRIMATMGSVVNTNCILSNLEERQINNIVLDVADNLALDVTSNYKRYDIDKSDFDRIIDMCVYMCFFALQRGYKEGERRFWKTTIRTRENINTQPDRDGQKDVWSRFWGGKNK